MSHCLPFPPPKPAAPTFQIAASSKQTQLITGPLLAVGSPCFSRTAVIVFLRRVKASSCLMPGKRSHWKTVSPLCCSCHLAVSHSFLIRDGGWERLSFELRHIGIRQRPFGGKLLDSRKFYASFSDGHRSCDHDEKCGRHKSAPPFDPCSDSKRQTTLVQIRFFRFANLDSIGQVSRAVHAVITV